MSDGNIFLIAFSTVMVGMFALTGFVYLLRYVAATTSKRSKSPASPGNEQTEIVDDPELIAVITAAAYTALGKKVRVHAVHIHRDHALDSWSRAGRMDIMFSHRIGPKR